MNQRIVTIPANEGRPPKKPPRSRSSSPHAHNLQVAVDPGAEISFVKRRVLPTVKYSACNNQEEEVFPWPATEKESVKTFKKMPPLQQYKYLRFLLAIAEATNSKRDPAAAEAARVEEKGEDKHALLSLSDKAMETKNRLGELLLNAAKLQGQLVAGAMIIFACVLIFLLMILAFKTGG